MIAAENFGRKNKLNEGMMVSCTALADKIQEAQKEAVSNNNDIYMDRVRAAHELAPISAAVMAKPVRE